MPIVESVSDSSAISSQLADNDSAITLTDGQKEAIRQQVKAKESKNAGSFLGRLWAALKAQTIRRLPESDAILKIYDNNEEFCNLVDSIYKGEQDLFNILPHLPSLLKAKASRSVKDEVNTEVGEWSVDDNHEKTSARAWSETYRGNTVELLKKAIDEMNTARGDKDYANFVPIVQSSGTGKSRAVDELARQVFTIPLNLRPPGDDTGYPKRDPGVLGFLGAQDVPASKVHIRYCKFFKHLFETITSALGQLETQESAAALAETFRAKLQSPNAEGNLDTSGNTSQKSERETLYARVIEKTEEDVRTTPPDQEEYASQALASASNLLELIKLKSGEPTAETSRKPTTNKAPGESMADELPRPVKLIIYFDECHPLTSIRPTNDNRPGRTGYSCYQILCSVIDKFRKLDLFVIFLSTNSKITVFSPPTQVFWSARGREKGTEGVQTPFNELPFDQWEHPVLLEEDKHTLGEVCLPSFMSRFGRPVIWTRYKYGDDSIKASIVAFARLKLAGTEKYEALSEDAQLAVFGVRVGLSFNHSRRLARHAESRMIEGHMRLAFSIPAHREYVYSGNSSEPILAEAAAQLMYMNGMTQGIPRVLLEWCENDLISKGDRGELVARLLVTKAHDEVIEQRKSRTDPPTYTSPIRLTDFLVALVGKDAAETIFNALPNNVAGGCSLKDSSLGKAKLNFTHWAKAGDDGAVTDEAAWIGLARNLAWQCFDSQEGVDLVTPLLLEDEDEGKNTKLGRFTVSAIFWQIKNRNRNQRVEVGVEKLKFFTRYDGPEAEKINSRPYITIVLNLGTAPGPNGATNPSPIQVAGPPTRASPRNPPSSPRHPRYAIVISGCSRNTFPHIIHEHDGNAYYTILRSKGLVEEHARSGIEFRRAVLQMKPAWKKGQGEDGSFSQVQRNSPSRLDVPSNSKASKSGRVMKNSRANLGQDKGDGNGDTTGGTVVSVEVAGADRDDEGGLSEVGDGMDVDEGDEDDDMYED